MRAEVVIGNTEATGVSANEKGPDTVRRAGQVRAFCVSLTLFKEQALV